MFVTWKSRKKTPADMDVCLVVVEREQYKNHVKTIELVCITGTTFWYCDGVFNKHSENEFRPINEKVIYWMKLPEPPTK